NVSHNNLAGDIPTSNNFSRFSPDSKAEFKLPSHCSFIGNPGLCGYWLSSTCHGSHPTERALRQMLKLETEKALELENGYQNNELPPHISISKAAILGIALGALVILLMILIAACRPHNPTPFPDGSLDKPGALPSPFMCKPMKSS
ncbi:hypothetical protein Godav_021915, partial [Gossypium davidsonii]|nr:hypothetical protein [Gossypium davidsonii]